MKSWMYALVGFFFFGLGGNLFIRLAFPDHMAEPDVRFFGFLCVIFGMVSMAIYLAVCAKLRGLYQAAGGED